VDFSLHYFSELYKKKDLVVSEFQVSSLSAPTSISVNLLTDTSMVLNWQDQASNELIYEVYGCKGSGCSDFIELSNSPIKKNSTSITVTGLLQNTIYNFQVRAANSNGSSAWLASGDISTNPNDVLAPTSFAINQKDESTIQFSWIDNATNETQYLVEKCLGAGCTNFSSITNSPLLANSTNVSLTGLSSSASYRFRIKAINSLASSPYLISGDIIMASAPPTLFSINSISSNRIDFSWIDNAIDESGYEIEKCVGVSCSNFVAVLASPIVAQSTSYVEMGLLENTAYQFRIRATNQYGKSSYLTGSSVLTLLNAPTNLVVNMVDDTSIQFSWVDNSGAESGYEVQRCLGLNCSDFLTLGISPLGVNTITLIDTGLAASSVYKYRLRAINSNNNSNWITSADIITGPVAPSGFVIGAVTDKSVSFTWTDNASDETYYQVERCVGSNCTAFSILSAILPLNTTGYTDSTVSGSNEYKYRIKALGSVSSSSYLSSSNITTAASPIAAASCTSPNHFILDYGAKSAGTLASSARGLYTDVNYIPTGISTVTSSTMGQPNGNIVNLSPAIGSAYIDSGAQAIKYSFWSGNAFLTEVVAGDTVANVTYVQLVYLSNYPNAGLPIIFWTNGAANGGQIMMAVRNTANVNVKGTWTLQAIDDGGGAINRALKASVNPNDGVALVYQSTTTPSIRFIYCVTNCNSPNSYNVMPIGNRLDTNSLTGQVNMGLAWCQHSSGNYSPAVVYGTTATSFTYAACLTYSSNPTNCLSATNWIKSTTPVVVGAGSGLVSDLYMDPSLLQDTPKIILKDNVAGLKTYTLPSCNSFVIGSAYTGPGATLVTTAVANAGSSFVKILKHPDYLIQSNERFFLVYNDGITDMRWAATNNSNNFGGAWLSSTGVASSIHNNAALLAAAGATSMGADLNPTTGQIITGYGTSIAGNFNATLGVIDGYLSPTDPSNATTNSYYTIPMESTGAIQMNATQYSNISLASTNTNKPAVAWVDFSTGIYTTGKLKYALRNGAIASGSSWNIINIPGPAGTGASSPLYPSLAFDNNNLPWIGYWDQTALRFVLATNTKSDGSGVWVSYMFPLTGAVNYGAPVAQPAANKVAVTMFYSGGVAYPVMIVINNSTTTVKSVRAAKLIPSTGKWSTPVNIDGALTVGGAAFLSADYDSSGKIVIAYQNLGAGAIRLKYSASTDGGLTWPVNSSNPYGVSTLNTGEGAVIKINPSSGNPSISYYDRVNNKLFFINCMSNCTGSGTPIFSGSGTSVLNGVGINNLSGLGNTNLLSASLTFAANGEAHILYNSGQLDSGALKFINNIGGTMPSGLATTLVAGVNGTYNTAATAGFNGGIPWGQQAVRISNGVFATAYITPGNWLGVTTCGD
jgi:hypothetical protein